ncbi:MAG TPA: hypothetical protein VIE64_00340 [Solirubrobacterales bacterium]
MSRSLQLLIAALAVVVSMLLTTGTSAAPGPRLGKATVVTSAPGDARTALAVRCEHPATLRLIRFEDGSAQLRCGRRILVRVSIPD